MTDILLSIRDAVYVPVASYLMWLDSVLINSTVRIKFIGEDTIAAVHGKGQRAVFAFWHQSTFSPFYYYRKRKICALPVDNYLGKILGGFLRRYGFRTISYPQGGKPGERINALASLIRTVKGGYDCGIAVDGPPDEKLYSAKPGVFFIAQRTGNPVLPVGVYYSDPLVLGFRWDKYQIPKPFSRATVLVGEPIYVKATASEADLEGLSRTLERTLHDLTEKAKALSGAK